VEVGAFKDLGSGQSHCLLLPVGHIISFCLCTHRCSCTLALNYTMSLEGPPVTFTMPPPSLTSVCAPKHLRAEHWMPPGPSDPGLCVDGTFQKQCIRSVLGMSAAPSKNLLHGREKCGLKSGRPGSESSSVTCWLCDHA
jgi:hypothetical protein